MAVKSKTTLGRIEHKEGRPKTTSIGNGNNSRPRRRRGRKPMKGQGK
jgi:hypothetical protein